MPVDPACRALQDRIADLANQVHNLELLEQDSGLTQSERNDIGKHTHDLQLQISALRAQLAECLSELAIHGVEFTQGIQYFDISGQGSGAGADNGIPLIAERALVLRVYPDARFGTPDPVALPLPVRVGGYVRVDRALDDGGFQPIKMITPMNGTIAARPLQAIDRGNPNHSLNFRLDAVDCEGTVRFTVAIFPAGPLVPGAPAGTATGIFSSVEAFAQFQPAPVFRARFVPVHFTGNGMDIPPPSALAAVSCLQYMLSTFPIGRLELGDCTPIDFGGNLDAPAAVGCSSGWDDLLMVLDSMQAATSDPAIFIATIAPQVPTGEVAGCGRHGVAAAVVDPLDYGTAINMAQEVGHAFDRKHSPFGGIQPIDLNFPHYGGYPWGSIGEFGFDTRTAQVYSPIDVIDFMGHCSSFFDCGRWVSPYTYLGIRGAMVCRFGLPAADRLGPATGELGGETLFLGFRLYRDNTAEVRPSFHLRGARQLTNRVDNSEVSVELHDTDGAVLVARRCHPLSPHQQQADEYVEFFEPLPWWPQAAAIVVLRGAEPVASIAIEATAPEVVIDPVPSELGKDATATMTWTTRHPERPVICLLRYSNDAGRTWRALAANLTETRYRLDASVLPGGSQCLIEVVASAGVRTTVARTPSFSVPVKPRRAHIVSPASEAKLSAGQPLVLQGSGYSPDFGLGAPEDARWTSSIDGPLGRGLEVLARGLSVGTHQVRLEVPDGLGGTSQALMTVSVTKPTSSPEP